MMKNGALTLTASSRSNVSVVVSASDPAEDSAALDQDVQRPSGQAVLQAREQGVHVTISAQLGTDGEGPPAGLLDLAHRLLGRLVVAGVVHRDQGALNGQPQCDRLADAARGTGHQGGLAVQSSHDALLGSD